MLNYFYNGAVLKLDFIYQMNLAMYNTSKPHTLTLGHMWNKLWGNARIIHYTLRKPFMPGEQEFENGRMQIMFDLWNGVYAQATR